MPLINEQDALAQTPTIPQPVAPAPQVTPPQDSGLDVAAAAFRQSNVLSSVVGKALSGGYTSYPDQPGYDPYANNGAEIKGYEDYASRFTRSTSPAQTQQIRNQIDAELQDKNTLARAGAAGVATSMAAGVVDPVSIALMAIPVAGEGGLAARLAGENDADHFR